MLISNMNPGEDLRSQRAFTQGETRAAGAIAPVLWATLCVALLHGANAVYAQQTQTPSAVAKTPTVHVNRSGRSTEMQDGPCRGSIISIDAGGCRVRLDSWK